LRDRHPARGERSALLLVDMLNPYEHRDADALAESVGKVVPAIARLADRARESGALLVYVNDNYGDWNSSAGELAKRALEGRRPELVEPILPRGEESFVIKARHSVFYATPLEYLLELEGIGRIVLSGQVTEQCILYSALDAYVRHFRVAVPKDGVAHIHPHLADAALEMMSRNMDAEITTAAECPLDER
jgi:nicotinamidase-related amidase